MTKITFKSFKTQNSMIFKRRVGLTLESTARYLVWKHFEVSSLLRRSPFCMRDDASEVSKSCVQLSSKNASYFLTMFQIRTRSIQIFQFNGMDQHLAISRNFTQVFSNVNAVLSSLPKYHSTLFSSEARISNPKFILFWWNLMGAELPSRKSWKVIFLNRKIWI